LKKIIVICEVFILAILLMKVAVVSGVMRDTTAVDHDVSEMKTATPPLVRVGDTSPVTDIFEDSLVHERKLFALLKEKEKELISREDLLTAEEKRLQELKQEVVAKIKELSGMQENLTVLLAAVDEFDNKKYKDLAKVYESTPAEQAGVMLNKMDTKMAAAIIMNMRSKKAGVVWGYIDPKKAVEITKEITNTGLVRNTSDNAAQ